MNKKVRKCANCAWYDIRLHQEQCHYEREPVKVYASWWCRHWSETTGWDVFEKPIEQEPDRIQKGLLRLAAELFEKELDSIEHQAQIRPLALYEASEIGVRQRWLEEYRTKC